jgi:hypothetical protein
MDEKIPCEFCSKLVPFQNYQLHVNYCKVPKASTVDITIECDICGKGILFSQYSAHASEHEKEKEKVFLIFFHYFF